MSNELRRLRARAHKHGETCYGRYEPCGEHHMHDDTCGSRPLYCRQEEDDDLIWLLGEYDRLSKPSTVAEFMAKARAAGHDALGIANDEEALALLNKPRTFIAVLRGDARDHDGYDPIGCGLDVKVYNAQDLDAAKKQAVDELLALELDARTQDRAEDVNLIGVFECTGPENVILKSVWQPVFDERRRARNEKSKMAMERYERSTYERLKAKFEPKE